MHNMNLLYDAKLAHAQNLTQIVATRLGTQDALAKAGEASAKFGMDRADLHAKTAEDTATMAHVRSHRELNQASPYTITQIQQVIRQLHDPTVTPATKDALNKKLVGAGVQ
jgi:ABC-type uncharacterized transport system substrate-binding protein